MRSARAGEPLVPPAPRDEAVDAGHVQASAAGRGTGTILADPAWRPDPRAQLLWGTEIVLSWLLPVIGFVVWAVLDDGRRGLQAVVGTVLVIAVVATVAVIPVWRYSVHRWEITDEAVYTRVGWLTQESRVAPISRVQTVDIERGPLDRAFGLATVTVTTASSAGAVPIAGLDLPVAEDAVARLTRIAALHRGDAT
ncbi:PH domain-containing protein [Nocardia asteroides]|uniref:PH domain-containing protein n=1 Tax=Nocardia asteroides TaxID=1824 RepID=UPI001E52342A|nr:PH domain-containing protein [Nocardia asteroides]UGT64941.1 PH domain-containing protein [Nocardia asteroides]